MRGAAPRVLLLLAVVLVVVAVPAAGAETCRTVEGAPAATSESMVLGTVSQMKAGDREGVQKFLDTGQVLLLRGGHEVEVLRENPEAGTLVFRRGARGLPLWTVTRGVECEESDGS